MRLRPMSQREFDEYRSAAIPALAQAEEEAYGLPAGAALARSEAAFERLVPGGQLTGSPQLWIIEGETEPVGVIWWGIRDAGSEAYIYDLLIWPAFRRRGYARAALRLLEEHLRGEGIGVVALNVFSRNSAAEALYRSLGFQPRSTVLAKAVG